MAVILHSSLSTSTHIKTSAQLGGEDEISVESGSMNRRRHLLTLFHPSRDQEMVGNHQRIFDRPFDGSPAL